MTQRKSYNVGLGIRNTRLMKHMTATELCRQANIPKSSLSDWESGKTTPSAKTFLRIVDVLDVSVEQLCANSEFGTNLNEEDNFPFFNHNDKVTTNKDLEHNFNQLTERQKETVSNIIKGQLGITQNEKIVSLKLFNQSACAGDGNYINSDDYEIVEFVNPPKTAAYTIRVQGCSMEPLIEDGDILYINTNTQLQDKDFGVFVYQGETFVKQIRMSLDKIILHSLNPKFKDIEIKSPDELFICGRVL